MSCEEVFESFPFSTVACSGALSLAIYAISVHILLQFGFAAALAYVAYVVLLEFRLYGRSCRHCCYHGKTCGLGKGRLASLFFAKGDPKKFIEDEVTFRDLLPDFLVTLAPMIAGIILLLKNFSWTILALIIALAVLGFPLVGLLRGKLVCPHCRQRELGCPAQEFFSG